MVGGNGICTRDEAVKLFNIISECLSYDLSAEIGEESYEEVIDSIEDVVCDVLERYQDGESVLSDYTIGAATRG